MNIALLLALAQAAGATEPLPVDERLAAYATVVPDLREQEARIDAEIGRLGEAEPGWEASGLSAESAVAAGGTVAEHVLGEWEEGGHGVVVSGDRPLEIPAGLRRYSIRAYDGQADYHVYHRAAPGIVLHTVGTVRKVGNAECQTVRGIEIISRESWQDWPPETALRVMSGARMTRDDSRTYCIIYRQASGGRFPQLAYAPDGRPYVAVNEDPQAFVLTSREEAISRIFDTARPSPGDR